MKRFTFLKRKTRILRRSNHVKLDCYRVYFIKSNKHYYASLIDNNTGNVILSITTQRISSFEKSSINRVDDLALEFANKVSKLDFINDQNIYFDRGVYQFHGLVKHFVSQIRLQGIKV